ncbi:MAG TPA: hypothetical protein VLM89_01215 [Phycisphaerae bacterium]|nr:hypothetical protein [Phycisphaerae bacterium]
MLRLLGLIWLTLAAASLPAEARHLASLDSRPAGQADRGGADPSAPDGDSRSEPDSPSWRTSPMVDVWDGHSTRTSIAASSTLRPVLPLSRVFAAHMVPDASFVIVIPAVEATPWTSGSGQRAWLSCRYAHAPPVM